MENKINIAELLKDCPKGMELDCTMFENCTFEGIDDIGYTEILVKTPSGQIRLTKEGCFTHNDKYAKCVIFPKGKTTWEGFQRPFKDGDIISNGNTIAIFKKADKPYIYFKKDVVYYHCIYSHKYNEFRAKIDFGIGHVEEFKYATEEEKQKLFDAIKEHGYKWNDETKTLEKLPKFNVGDRVRNKNYKDYIYDIHDITDKGYRAKEIDADSPIIILFGSEEDNYELVPNKFDINTLKPYDKVLYRMHDKDTWCNSFYSFYKSNHHFVTSLTIVKQCIPYNEDTKHLLGTTDDCDEFYKTWE